MKRYNDYKDTCGEWMGVIPNHWDIKQFRRIFLIKKDLANCLGYNVLSVTQKGLKVKDIESNEGQIASDYSKYQIVCPGDYVMNSMDLLTGYVDCSTQKGVTSPDYKTFRTRRKVIIDKSFYLFIFQLCYKARIFYNLGRGVSNKGRWRLPSDNLNRFLLPIPPLREQLVISDYLKVKTSKIEQYVAQRERELLDSLRQSEIANVVTKGLNPNAPMKDSGIPWIGMIPEHWGTRKIKFLFKERSEKGFPNEPVLCATQKYGVIPQEMYENRVVVVNKGLEGLKLVKVGDFVISLRSFQGGIEYAYYQGIISAAYTILEPSEEVDSNYIKYLFKSHPFICLLQTCVTGIREGQNINYDMLRKNSIMLPPLSEQQAIVKYIDSKLSKIDQYMADLQAEIDYLKEFKQRLISDAVTGQICVAEPQKGDTQ
ncbi:MAG: restriction endonuclease subunit S [Prevotella sp.]|nr:restriction endonuclease subunit S [Prevotella sp.]